MKKVNIFLILLAIISLAGLGAVLTLTGGEKQPEQTEQGDGNLTDYKDNFVDPAERNKEIIVSVQEGFSYAPGDDIYNERFQSSVRSAIDALISVNRYTQENPLVIYNPFLTNSQSLYVYFETEQPYAVSYSVHTPDEEYEDFGGYVIPSRPDTSTVHEFQIIGLIPDTTNMITLRLTDKDGVVTIRRFYYYNENPVDALTLQLEVEQGMKQVQNEDKTFSTVPASEETVAEGMFMTFPMENEVFPYLRIYDNDGTQRAEIPLDTYGTKNCLMVDDLMYYMVSDTKIAGVNRLGQAVQVYTADGYTFGEDYCLDKNNDILVLASLDESLCVHDRILLIERASGEVTELVDMADLLPEYRVLCKEENGEIDWLHLNSIDLVDGNRILVNAEATGTVIKIRRLYNDPRIAFMVGDTVKFTGTSYVEDCFLRVDNEFEMHHNAPVVLYQEYDKIRESRHYIYLLNNNENAKYAKREEAYAFYYRYLVDEAEFGVRLVDTMKIPAVGEEGNVQWYKEHLLLNNDLVAEFHEYDSDFQLISTYRYVKPKVDKSEEQLEYEEDFPPADDTVLFARVKKYDFFDYYFTKDAVIILPVVPVTEEGNSEGNLTGNE